MCSLRRFIGVLVAALRCRTEGFSLARLGAAGEAVVVVVLVCSGVALGVETGATSGTRVI